MAESPKGTDGAIFVELSEVMTRLRRDCVWKASQTHESLTRYLLEETYEVIEAIETGDPDHLREELGDLLLQVFFHAAIAAEAGEYDVTDVAGDLLAKLIRRNPHVFANVVAEDLETVNENWESIKATEKQRLGLTEGIPEELPALLRATKVLDRLARAGQLPDLPGDSADLGDRLLALAAEARAGGLDPEQELRRSIRRISC